MRPLLQLRNRRAVKSGRDPSVKPELAGKFDRHRRRAVAAPALGENSSRNAARELEIHGPKREPDAIPTEVAETTEGLQFAVGSDIGVERLRRRAETESRG